MQIYFLLFKQDLCDQLLVVFSLSLIISLSSSLFPASVSLLLSLISKPTWTLCDNYISINVYVRELKRQSTLCQPAQ